MRYIIFLFVFLSTHSFAQKIKSAKKPMLMVGIVVDQMRQDFLYRYAERYSTQGFRRLLQQGNSCENVFINYLPSFTGPGHACIYTGSVPSLHGIASNDWLDKMTGNAVYCTQDEKATNVGGNVKSGKMSPKNMWASTITDELRLASNMKSKVIAISVKDRASILPGGHLSNASYWLDDSLGQFMTSSHYMKALPNWVTNFNALEKAKNYLSNDWTTLFPIETYTQSTTDDNQYEGKFVGEINPTFPHKLSHLKPSDVKKTPFGNSLLIDFAKQAIEQEKLGQGIETDFLAISFSSPDYVGHLFAPNSVEVEDTYLRLDKDLSNLLSYLDEKVGDGNYSLFLTADHGVAHNPQFLLDHKMPAGYMFGSVLKLSLNTQLNEKFSVTNLVKDVGENFVWLNNKSIDSAKINRQEIINFILSQLASNQDIHFAIDMQNIHQAVVPQKIKDMATNGYVANRSGDILLILKPAYLDAYAKTGTTHGTWNPYDTHIPLIWYGWGIKKGISYKTHSMTDIAATIASLLHIQMPNACIGEAIDEVIK
jgi:predicted AlkP superfamily pyrophosphatase or phosphodiesterase